MKYPARCTRTEGTTTIALRAPPHLHWWPETASVTIAVNASARQLRQADFVERVLTVLDRTAANPKTLKLELTESLLVNDVEEVIAKMTKLKLHGLKFSLDDFGTGYSSLSYLGRLPLDELKVDRSFLENILDGGRGGAIAKTIISLGSALGMSVLAEGVETEKQRDCLAASAAIRARVSCSATPCLRTSSKCCCRVVGAAP